jgi:plastocyanin
MRPTTLALAALTVASGAAAQQHAHPRAAAPATAATAAAAAPSPAARARVVTVTARDYAFEAPDTIAAGLTTVRLVNRGPELHHVQLLRLDDGKTLADLNAALKAGGPPPRWVRDVGGPNTPVPGGESRATLDLAPGRYVIACFIPSADQTPHIAKGMVREITVRGPQRAAAPAARGAAAPVTLTLRDYGFDFSRPLVAGAQTVRVRNVAAQSHEVLFVRLAPGKTVADVAAWAEKLQGPPPGQPLGGTTGIATDGWNDVALTLEPGEYGMLCFLPDAKDGKPHIAHGMMHQFRVDAPARRTATRAGTR